MTADPFNLSADFPPHHESEPASLRQDILDELADHLACSLRREAVLTPDEDQARRNVLQRFGNPAQIARKLWRDAMWEKIMLQRLSLGLSLVSMVAIVVVGLVLWRMVEQSNASQAEMLSQFKLSQQEILSQLTRSQADMANRQQEFASSILGTLKSQSVSTASHDNWVPLEIQLVSESGSPVKGTVHVKSIVGKGEIPAIDMDIDANNQGVATLGQLTFGRYELTVTLTEPPVSTQWEHLVRPGTSPVQKILCPTTLPETEVRFDVHPPQNYTRAGMQYLGVVEERMVLDGRTWKIKAVPSPLIALDATGAYRGRVVESIYISNKWELDTPTTRDNVGGLSRLRREKADLFNLIGIRSKDGSFPNGRDAEFGSALDGGSLFDNITVSARFLEPGPFKIRGNECSLELLPELLSNTIAAQDLPEWLASSRSTNDCFASSELVTRYSVEKRVTSISIAKGVCEIHLPADALIFGFMDGYIETSQSILAQANLKRDLSGVSSPETP